MITANRSSTQPASTCASISTRPDGAPRWQQLWREAVTDPVELLQMLGLDDYMSRVLLDRDTGFPLRVPRGFVARMGYGDPRDPLLLQVLPQLAELQVVPGFVDDAVGDLAARAAPGVLQKYRGRALLVATGSCAIHCRYCFRRHFPYAEETAASQHWHAALEALRTDSSLDEAILSGGDPLSLSDAKLAEFGTALNAIPHVRRLRIHTRLPIVLPERIDHGFCHWLSQQCQQKIIVLHANHAQEIDASVIQACRRLTDCGVLLLNQSVLLRGINDNVIALQELSERLLEAGAMPYYLHQLDRVSGTAHFEVDDSVANRLIEELRARVSGYLVPRLVREITGATAKTPL
ncbi:MAG: EF-P beta-lysylation protein EpmB [Tahibacter sp.]